MKSFSDYIDRCVVINLPSRTDRKRDMLQELHRHRLNADFLSAIRPDDKAGFPSIGARGCFLSHLTLLKQARDDGVKNLVIMEDDLTISDQFDQAQQGLIDTLDSRPWAFAYFGHRLDLEEQHAAAMIPHTGPIIAAHFVGINGTVLPTLVDFLETMLKREPGHPDGGPMHVDGAYSTFREQHPELVTLVANPPMGSQRSSISDITNTNRWQMVPFIRPLFSMAYSVKNWWKRC